MDNLKGSIHARLRDFLVLIEATLSDEEVEDSLERVCCNEVSGLLDDLCNSNSVKSLVRNDSS